MTMPLRRLALVASIAAASLLSIGATQALAATDVDLQPSSSGSTLDIDDLTSDDDAIVVSVAGGTITVVDTGTGGIATADLECTLVNPTTVTCPLDPADPAPPALPMTAVRFIDIEMRDGTDSFTNVLLADVEMSDGGETGNKTVSSGPGDDEIETGVGNDVVNLGAGDNETDTDAGNDTITGGPGEDDINPEAGADVANAGGGTDDIDDEGQFNDGPDVLDGGPGPDDEIEYDGTAGETAGVTMTIDGVADDGHAGEGDNLAGFEDLNGTPGADRMVGASSNDELFPDAGDDTINGGGGNDELGPGEGNDVVEGGEGSDEIEGESRRESGADALNGGPGADMLDYDGSEAISFTLNGAADDGRAGEGDNVANIEGVDGTEKGDTLVGNGASNQLFGFGGGDTITGGGGNDALNGGDGDDVLLALGGRDDVRCGLGFDTPIHDAEDVIAGGCERRGAEVVSDSAFANRKGRARVRVSCPAEEGATCRGTVVLLSNGKLIGSGRFSVANGGRASATVRLTRQGRRALSTSGSGLRVTAEARTTEPQGVSVNAAALELDNVAKKAKRKKKKKR